MSSTGRKLILDADGVFLDERPYWDAALACALDLADLGGLVGERWPALSDTAFDRVRLQLATKAHGCNSNWDLAALLADLLDDDRVRSVVAAALCGRRETEASLALLEAAEARWAAAGASDGDPLLRVGIDRRSTRFGTVVERFQRALQHGLLPGQDPVGFRSRESPAVTRRTLERAVDLGFEPVICTGRHRAEIEPPIASLGLSGLIPAGAIVCGDDVDRAERERGCSGLAKPHWFPVACALLGYDHAITLLDGAEASGIAPGPVYVGDAWADFVAVGAARRHGLPLQFVHVSSGVTTEQQEQTIAGTAHTVGRIVQFSSLPDLLCERVS